MRKTIQLVSFITVVAGLPALASAEDLADYTRDLARSRSGALLDEANKRIRILGPKRNVDGDALRAALKARGVRLVASGPEHRWEDTTLHETGRRTMSRRRRDTGALYGELGAYLDKRPRFTKTSLRDAAVQVVQTVLEEQGLLGADEEVRPIATRYLRFRAMSADRKDELQAVVAASVELRRYVDDVPVLGPRGLVLATFDADHSLIELDYYARSYELQSAGAPSKARGAAGLEVLLQRHGMPTPSQPHARQAGVGVTLSQLECGYYDDGETGSLRRGCSVDLRDDTGGLASRLVLDDERPSTDDVPETRGDMP